MEYLQTANDIAVFRSTSGADRSIGSAYVPYLYRPRVEVFASDLRGTKKKIAGEKQEKPVFAPPRRMPHYDGIRPRRETLQTLSG